MPPQTGNTDTCNIRGRRIGLRVGAILIGVLSLAGASRLAAETLTIDAPETAAICGYRALWDTPILAASNGVRVVTDEKVKDRGGVAPFALSLRANGAKPAALAFDAMHRYLLVRFPDAADRLAAKCNEGFAVEKAELVLPFADEELWPEGSPNGVPSGGGYGYRANWNTDARYRQMRPTWHALAWALRRPWKADAELGPTYNAFINGAGYWAHFGAQDDQQDRVPVQFGPTPVNYMETEGRMDITAALADPAFGASPAARLRRLADCGFILRKWETYDHRYYFGSDGAYEWSTGTGPRAIVVNPPRLTIALKRSPLAVKIDLPPAADIAKLAAELKQGDRGGRPAAVMPTPAELKKIEERFRWSRKPDMPEWQWQRIRELFAATYGPGAQDEPFWCEFVAPHIKNALRDQAGNPDPMRVYEAYVDDILGKPYRGWNGFEAGPVLVTWFIYRDALPLPAQECYRNFWTAWLMPDRASCDPAKIVDPNSTDGTLVHPQTDQLSGFKPGADGIGDAYYAKTGDWHGNKSFYRSGYNYTMSTMNFNNTASMGALLGGSIIGSERSIADGRHGQANFPLRLWSWFDGSTQEEGDDYYLCLTLRAQKMIADFGPDIVDRVMGRSMLLKGMTMLADDYHPGLRRFITGASRSADYFRLVTQDGLSSIVHTLSQRGALTDLGVAPETLPEGEAKFGHEFPPEQVARTAAYSSYAPAWYQPVIDEKSLPYEVTATYKRWGAHMEHPLMKKTYLGRNYGVYTVSSEEGYLPSFAQWRRRDREATASREVGTMVMRMGINQTRFVNDWPGGITSYGGGAILQAGPTFIASFSPWGAGLDVKRKITSVQASLAFFNYELPKPTWEIYVDERRVESLPLACREGQKIVIHDGVTYIGIVPLPGSNLGRREEVVLREGESQSYLNTHHAKPALVIDHYILQRAEEEAAGDVVLRHAEPLAPGDVAALKKAATGFAVEFADAEEYPDVKAFLKHMREVAVAATVDTAKDVHEIRYASGTTTLEMGAVTTRQNSDAKMAAVFTRRRVNGVNPDLPAGVERDSPFSLQATTGRLEKNGATLRADAGQQAVLQCEPRTGVVLGANPLTDLNDFVLKTPERIEVAAAGKIGIALVTVDAKGGRVAIDHAFLPAQANDAAAAEALLVFGLRPGFVIFLNGTALASPATIDVEGRPAVVVPLKDGNPDPVALVTRYRAAR